MISFMSTLHQIEWLRQELLSLGRLTQAGISTALLAIYTVVPGGNGSCQIIIP